MTADLNSPYLELLKNRINLREIPFSERGSRLLIFQNNQHFAVRLAERWFKVDQRLSGYRQRPPLINDWLFTDGDGLPLEFTVTTYPHRIDVHTARGTFTIVFADTETLLVLLPPGGAGVTFRAQLDQAQTDRRGGILRLTGDIRRNLAYTTNVPIAVNEVAATSDHSQRIRLIVQSDAPAPLLINITPRLGFNRYVPQPDWTIAAAAQRWHAWFAAAPPVAPAPGGVVNPPQPASPPVQGGNAPQAAETQ